MTTHNAGRRAAKFATPHSHPRPLAPPLTGRTRRGGQAVGTGVIHHTTPISRPVNPLGASKNLFTVQL
jgi:hypothetical protein